MTHLNTLLKLKQSGELNYSQIPNALLKKLSEESLIEIKTLSAKRKKVVAKEQFYKVYENIEDIQKATNRAELTKVKSDTKAKKISPQDGLYINGVCEIDGVKLPLFSNSAIFLKELPKLSKNILVVVVENFENLIYFEKQLKYFQDDKILFIYRNSAMLRFIRNLENKIIYFGDFDLAGISIYQNEVLPKNKNIKLFIPTNIEKLIDEFGSTKLYKKQYEKYKNLKSNSKDTQKLITIIHKNQKSLEQEFFI